MLECKRCKVWNDLESGNQCSKGTIEILQDCSCTSFDIHQASHIKTEYIRQELRIFTRWEKMKYFRSKWCK